MRMKECFPITKGNWCKACRVYGDIWIMDLFTSKLIICLVFSESSQILRRNSSRRPPSKFWVVTLLAFLRTWCFNAFFWRENIPLRYRSSSVYRSVTQGLYHKTRSMMRGHVKRKSKRSVRSISTRAKSDTTFATAISMNPRTSFCQRILWWKSTTNASRKPTTEFSHASACSQRSAKSAELGVWKPFVFHWTIWTACWVRTLIWRWSIWSGTHVVYCSLAGRLSKFLSWRRRQHRRKSLHYVNICGRTKLRTKHS